MARTFDEDHPKAGDLATSRYTQVRRDGEALEVSFAPVEFTCVKPGDTPL